MSDGIARRLKPSRRNSFNKQLILESKEAGVAGIQNQSLATERLEGIFESPRGYLIDRSDATPFSAALLGLDRPRARIQLTLAASTDRRGLPNPLSKTLALRLAGMA